MKTKHGLPLFLSLLAFVSIASCNTSNVVETADVLFVNNSSFSITALYLEPYSTTIDTAATVKPEGAFDQLKTVPDTLITGQKYTINYIPVDDYYMCIAFDTDPTDVVSEKIEYVVDSASTEPTKPLYKYAFVANASYTITFTDDAVTSPTKPVASALVKN